MRVLFILKLSVFMLGANKLSILAQNCQSNNQEIREIKLRLILWIFFRLSLFSSLLIFNNDRALAGYYRCKYVTKEAPTHYCFKQGDSGRLIKVLVEDLRKAGYYKYQTTTVFNSKV